jgi:hypothetical protein
MHRSWLAAAVVVVLAFWGASTAAEPAPSPTGTAASAEDARIERAMESYLHGNYGLRYEAISILRTGGVRTLEAWRRHATANQWSAPDNFTTQVLPYLPEAEVDAYLLSEFRRSLPEARKYQQFLAHHAGNKPWTEADQAEASRMAPVEIWMNWLGGTRPTLGFITSYDEAYALLVDPDFGSMAWWCSRALVRIDPIRAAADFAKLVQSPDPVMQVRGLAGYSTMESLPEAEVWRRLIASPNADVLGAVQGALYHVKRAPVELIIPLVANPGKEISRLASYKLGQMSWMTERQVDERVGGLSKSEDRAAAWQKWWDGHKSSTEDDLREAGLKALIVDIEGNAPWDPIYRMVERLRDRPELVPPLQKALASDNPSKRQSVASLLSRMEGKAQPAAVEAFLAYCRAAPPSEAALQYYFLGRLKDPRAVDLLLKLMETEPAALGFYGNSYGPGPSTLGPDGDKRAAEIFYRWIVEKHNQLAAVYFAAIPGTEAYLPRLLEVWFKEPDEKNRSVLREAVAGLGDSRLGPELARLLAETKSGTPLESEVLDLMIQFLDAGAKPLLLERLKAGHLREHIALAKVLARLGDFSGADALLDDLRQGRPEDFESPRWVPPVGRILREIGAPEARSRLLALYEKAEAKDRGRILDSLVEVHDTANLEFFEGLLESPDKSTAKIAFRGLVDTILYSPQPYGGFSRSMPEEYQPLVRSLLLYERFDEPLQPTDGKFRHDTSLKWDEAYLAVDFTQYFIFTAKDRVLKVVKTGPYSGTMETQTISPQMEKDLEARPGPPPARGSAFWHRHDKYLLLDVRVGTDRERINYIFKFDGRQWNPLRGDGGQ